MKAFVETYGIKSAHWKNELLFKTLEQKLPLVLNLPAPIYKYTWVERGTVGVKSIAQQHSTMLPAKARAALSENF